MFRYIILFIILFILSPCLINCDDKPKWVYYEWFSDGIEYIDFSNTSYHFVASDNHENIWIARNYYDKYNPIFLIKFDGKNWKSHFFYRDDYADMSKNISCIAIDDDNIVWIGSRDSGMYRFDGNEIININKDNSELNSNHITDIYILNNRPLITAGAGLHHYKEGEWVIHDSIFKALPDTSIGNIRIGQNNEIWVNGRNQSTRNMELIKYDGLTWTVYDSSNSKLPYEFRDFNIDSDNDLWVATSDGIVHFKNGDTWEIYNSDITGSESNKFHSVLIDKNNKLWFGGYDAIYSYDKSEWKRLSFEDVPFTSNRGYPIVSGRLEFVDNNNNLWIYSEDNHRQMGFLVYNENGLEGIEYFPSSVINNGESFFEILPNPSSEQAEINFYVRQDSHVKIQIIDALGSTIQIPLNEYQSEGEKRININTSLYSPGIYFCVISIGKLIGTKKMIVLR